MEGDWQALHEACGAQRTGDAERLREGETLWFTGRAAPAERGTVALTRGDLTMIVAEADARAARRRDDAWSLGVRGDANVIFRLERTLRADSLKLDAKRCEAADEGRPGLRGIAIGDRWACLTALVCFGTGAERICVEIFYDCEVDLLGPPERRSEGDDERHSDASRGLQGACGDERESDVERLKHGETLWLSGHAEPAEAGTVAIRQGHLTIIVAEADVRGARRERGLFTVGVRADANVHFRIERTVRVGSLPEAATDCAACGGEKYGEPRFKPKDDDDWVVVEVCKLLPLCITIWGRTYCIRIPYDCETFPRRQ